MMDIWTAMCIGIVLGFLAGLLVGYAAGVNGWGQGHGHGHGPKDKPFERYPYGPGGVRKHRQDVGSEADMDAFEQAPAGQAADNARQAPDSGPCSECGGETIKFRFSGKDRQYWICPRWEEPGHLSKAEIQQRYAEDARQHSQAFGARGRFA